MARASAIALPAGLIPRRSRRLGAWRRRRPAL